MSSACTRRVLAVALALGPVSASIQELPAQGRLHLLGGVTTARFTQETAAGPDDAHLVSRGGFVMGAGSFLPLRGGLGVAPEVLYSEKGAEAETGTARIRLRYVQVPLLLRHEFAVTGAVRPHLTAGPVLSWLAQCDFDGGGPVESCDSRYGSDDSYGRFDAGLMVGGGVRWQQLALVARYELGLSDINRAEGYLSRNRARYLAVMLLF
jgi:hypothetical protein